MCVTAIEVIAENLMFKENYKEYFFHHEYELIYLITRQNITIHICSRKLDYELVWLFPCRG